MSGTRISSSRFLTPGHRLIAEVCQRKVRAEGTQAKALFGGISCSTGFMLAWTSAKPTQLVFALHHFHTFLDLLLETANLLHWVSPRSILEVFWGSVGAAGSLHQSRGRCVGSG